MPQSFLLLSNVMILELTDGVEAALEKGRHEIKVPGGPRLVYSSSMSGMFEVIGPAHKLSDATNCSACSSETELSPRWVLWGREETWKSLLGRQVSEETALRWKHQRHHFERAALLTRNSLGNHGFPTPGRACRPNTS